MRFELPFRPGTPMGPVEIQGKSGVALLTGAVDRVDLLHTPQGDYVRVVDYKTGHRDFDYTDLLTGLGLQMLLYLFALEENGAREFGGPVKPAGVLYFPARCNLLTLPQPPSPDALAAVRQKDLRRQGLLLDDEALLQAMEPAEGTPRYLPYSVKKDGRSGDLASPAQLVLLRQHVRRLLAGMTDELFAGKITANPYSRGATGACTYCDYAPVLPPRPVPAPPPAGDGRGGILGAPGEGGGENMAKFELTPQQRQAVEETGGALLVSAAAGSGKTKVLVDRLLRQVTKPGDALQCR